jgi:hypothetical protein
LNSWIIHVFMKQERNRRKVWETSFKNKVIPALILFLKTYMYRIPHTIHSIFIFMFIEKTLKIIININLHYLPPMCQCQKIKVTHEVMTNSPNWLLENGSHSGERIGVVLKYDSEIGSKSNNSDKNWRVHKGIRFFEHTNLMVILKSVCARVCVCDMGKRGRACENSHGTHWSRFRFFSFLFLYLSLKLKTQPIQLRDRPFNLKGGQTEMLCSHLGNAYSIL